MKLILYPKEQEQWWYLETESQLSNCSTLFQNRISYSPGLIKYHMFSNKNEHCEAALALIVLCIPTAFAGHFQKHAFGAALHAELCAASARWHGVKCSPWDLRQRGGDKARLIALPTLITSEPRLRTLGTTSPWGQTSDDKNMKQKGQDRTDSWPGTDTAALSLCLRYVTGKGMSDYFKGLPTIGTKA